MFLLHDSGIQCMKMQFKKQGDIKKGKEGIVSKYMSFSNS